MKPIIETKSVRYDYTDHAKGFEASARAVVESNKERVE